MIEGWAAESSAVYFDVGAAFFDELPFKGTLSVTAVVGLRFSWSTPMSTMGEAAFALSATCGDGLAFGSYLSVVDTFAFDILTSRSATFSSFFVSAAIGGSFLLFLRGDPPSFFLQQVIIFFMCSIFIL